MKRVGLIVLGLVFITVLVIAGGTPEDSVIDDKIIIDTFTDLSPESMKKALIAAGMEDKVELRITPMNQYESKLKILISSGTVGDIVCIDAPNIAYYADLGALEPLDEYWDSVDFNDLVGSAQEAMTWNGKIWASPLNESNCVLYYNKNMFDKAGITAANGIDNAWTMEELLEAAKKLTITNDSGETEVYGIMPQMFSVDQRNEGMTYTQILWTWWFGANIISPDGKTVDGYFNSPESLNALQFYADLFNKYKVAPSISMTNFFASEKVAMWITGPWMTGIWENDFPEFYNGGAWGAMPLPKGIAAASNSGSWNLAVTSQSKNKEMAFQVIQAITGPQGSAIFTSETGNLPARKSVLEKTDMNTVPFNVIQEQLLSTSRARPITPFYPQISEALMTAYNNVAYGQDVNKAFNEAVHEMNSILK